MQSYLKLVQLCFLYVFLILVVNPTPLFQMARYLYSIQEVNAVLQEVNVF